MNGFAVSSAEIGDNRPITGRASSACIAYLTRRLRLYAAQYYPSFCPTSGGAESHYLEKIYRKKEMIEPLCNNTRAEGCYFVGTPRSYQQREY